MAALQSTVRQLSSRQMTCHGMREKTMKKIEIRKTGPVRLTSVAHPLYQFLAIAGAPCCP
jgi:hypothetical protein